MASILGRDSRLFFGRNHHRGAGSEQAQWAGLSVVLVA
jgi:hypothetical protein